MKSISDRINETRIQNLRWTQDVLNDTMESIDKRLESRIENIKDRVERDPDNNNHKHLLFL